MVVTRRGQIRHGTMRCNMPDRPSTNRATKRGGATSMVLVAP
ncbi:hypothetical protein HMPREF1979_02775, partial [Actinomyces johnsonii F0542]